MRRSGSSQGPAARMTAYQKSGSVFAAGKPKPSDALIEAPTVRQIGDHRRCRKDHHGDQRSVPCPGADAPIDPVRSDVGGRRRFEVQEADRRNDLLDRNCSSRICAQRCGSVRGKTPASWSAWSKPSSNRGASGFTHILVDENGITCRRWQPAPTRRRSYVKVLNDDPGARLVGFTGDSFRAGDERLNPRLEDGARYPFRSRTWEGRPDNADHDDHGEVVLEGGQSAMRRFRGSIPGRTGGASPGFPDARSQGTGLFEGVATRDRRSHCRQWQDLHLRRQRR